MIDHVPSSRQEVIEAFVIRARRIEAHSLVRNAAVLADHAENRFDVRLHTDGTTRLVHRLPPDEEIFESLAARVRPLILKQESIYHYAVTKALKRLLDTSSDPNAEQHRGELNDLRDAWKATASGETYHLVQWTEADDPLNLTPVSNVLLAEAWMYIDLVHADPDETRRAALGYSMRTRYVAAVRYYCQIAQLAVRTLRYVEKLRDAGLAVLENPAWEREIVVGSEVVEEATLYIAPIGTEPAAGDYSEEPGEHWKKFTAIEAFRQDPTKRLRVVLSRADGSQVASYDAALVLRPAPTEGEQRVDVLITDGVVCHLRFPVVDGELGMPSMELVERSESNIADLALHRFQLQAAEASTMEFYREQDEEPHLTFTTSDLTVEQIKRLRASIEALEDLQALERLTRQRLGRFTGVSSDVERVLLRVTRRLYEGGVVELVRSIGPRVKPSGQLPLEEHSCLVREEPKTLRLAGAEVPMPAFVLWHPQVSTHDLGPAPEHGAEARLFKVVAPEGQRFLAWAPEICPIAPANVAQHVEPWSLSEIDQDTFPL
jgi:hypothetical protein